jgi:hypothetical protein
VASLPVPLVTQHWISRTDGQLEEVGEESSKRRRFICTLNSEITVKTGVLARKSKNLGKDCRKKGKSRVSVRSPNARDWRRGV